MRFLLLVAAIALSVPVRAQEPGAEPSSLQPPASSLPTLTVTPAPISLPLRRSDGEDVRLLSQLMAANKAESLLELALRFASVVEQQAAQIAQLQAELAERDKRDAERWAGIEARVRLIEEAK